MNIDVSTTHPFENPDEVYKSLLEFKNTNWYGKTVNDISLDYIKRFSTLPTYPIVVKKGTMLFRGRPHLTKNQALFENLKDISIKPAELVTSFGRANIPNQPTFYCSTREETVVREVTQWHINDSGRFQDMFTKNAFAMGWDPNNSMMTISVWLVKEDLNIALIFGNEEKRSLAIQEASKNRYVLNRKESSASNRSKNLLLDFFSSEFGNLTVKHQYEYIFSAFYAFNILYNQPLIENSSIQFDGVKYPSIANNFRGENYAISEAAFKNKIDFLGANFCYTCNNVKPIIDNGTTAIIGRDKCAFLNNDSSFIWGDCTDEFDYVVRINGEYLPLNLENIPDRFSKAVKRISIPTYPQVSKT